MKEEIRKFFKGETEDGEETLVKYSRDASIFSVKPKLVLFPKDSEDVRNLVKWVGENKARYPGLSITARSAGTDMSGGAIGEWLVIDFTRHMNKLLAGPEKIEEAAGGSDQGRSRRGASSAITVQPGMFYRDFEKITLEHGLILPCFTASKSLNAMGGMFGNNAGGERTLKYGKTEDYVLEAKVVLADGNEYVIKSLSKSEYIKKAEQNNFEGKIYREIGKLIKENKEEIQKAKPAVHKNSAGYYLWNVERPNGDFDLNRLLVGSQGTLGIATEITFKLIPEHRYSKLVAIFMKDIAPLGELVDKILELEPETLESYDDKTLRLAVRFAGDFLKRKGFLGMLKLGWSFLPEFFMMLSGGFPKLVLLAEFEGKDALATDKKCRELVRKIADFKLKTHITKSETEAEKYWDVRRESFNLLRKHSRKLRTASFIDDIIVRPEFLPKFLPELEEVMSHYRLVYTLAGHAGDGNFHIIPLMDFSSPETAAIILELSDKVYSLVLKYGGSITAEHNDGLVRTPYLSEMYGEKIMSVFKRVKEIFDSGGIFNPGKKIAVPNGAGTKEYLKCHIAF